jgi:hypothetical protein
MKPSPQSPTADSARSSPAKAPAEARPPAIVDDANTLVYLGETKGPKPTKYFVTVYFNVPQKAG